MPDPIDLFIEGTVITMDPERRVIRDGAVAVGADRIVAVGEADELRARYEPRQTLGGERRMVIPGLIDCHNHLAQALVREWALEDLPNIYRVYIPAEMVMDAHDAWDDGRMSAWYGWTIRSPLLCCQTVRPSGSGTVKRSPNPRTPWRVPK